MYLLIINIYLFFIYKERNIHNNLGINFIQKEKKNKRLLIFIIISSIR